MSDILPSRSLTLLGIMVFTVTVPSSSLHGLALGSIAKPCSTCSQSRFGFVGTPQLGERRKVELWDHTGPTSERMHARRPGLVYKMEVNVTGSVVADAIAAIQPAGIEEASATTATSTSPVVDAPFGRPQPRECSHGPVGDPPPRSIESPEVCRTRSSSGPFSIPDNAYRDSWLDSLWINLFSSRMSAALEREEFPAVRGTLGPESVDPVGRAGPRTTEAPGVTTAGGCGSETTPTRRYTPERTRASRTRFLFDGMGFGGAKRGGTRLGVNGGAVTTGAAGGDHYTYEEYVALAKRLQAGPPESQRQIVRGVLRSILPRWFPALYRTLFPPSKFSAEVNAFMCSPMFAWLVGESELSQGVVDLEAIGGAPARQEVWRSTVKVKRCRYLEASKCKGTCINLCKLPTEAFFREDLGLPLRMTPNFDDLSCEFAFGQAATPVENDPLMQEGCWTECLKSSRKPQSPQRACHTMPESPMKRSRVEVHTKGDASRRSRSGRS